MPEIITENLSVNKFSSALGALGMGFESLAMYLRYGLMMILLQ